MENTINKIIYKKLCGFVGELIKEDPPFDDIHQLEAMSTIYKNYINSYHELEGAFRKEVIASLRRYAGGASLGPFFDAEESFQMESRELGASRQFQEWYRSRYEVQVHIPMSEKVDAKAMLKNEIPKRYPGLIYKRVKGQSYLMSFAENLYDDTDLLVCFSKSYSMVHLCLGVTEPQMLRESYLLRDAGHYFGGGYFTISFNSHKEFDQGRAELYKFLDFFLPKFKNALFEARQEWLAAGEGEGG